jgi:putative phosphoribosyl transferase
MDTRFLDRRDAGKQLAVRLPHYRLHPEVIVLALPRGGVPVAFEVAREIKVPLDVFVVRKLGAPGHQELAMGAIASGGVQVLNQDVIRELGISEMEIEAAAVCEMLELERRERDYRGNRPPLEVHGLNRPDRRRARHRRYHARRHRRSSQAGRRQDCRSRSRGRAADLRRNGKIRG